MAADDDLDRIRLLLARSLDAPTADDELQSLLAPLLLPPAFLDQPLPQLLGLSQPPPVNLTGDTLDQRYLCIQKITQTGFATVYLAHDTAISLRPVIVKVLDQLGSSPTALQLFHAEVQSLAAIHHPGVVNITDSGLTPTQFPYLVLTYVPGPTLRQLLTHGPIPLPRALPILRSLCRALTAIHRAGVAHLDLKPENIIISDPGTPDERPTILDFGIARLRSASNQWISAGSLRYMAPEQSTNPSARSDVYSLGLVAVEILTGRLPASGQPPPLHALAPALQPDPAERYPTAAEFGDAIDHIPPANLTWPWATLAATLLLLPPVLYFFHRPETFYSQPLPLVTRSGPDRDPALSSDGQWLYFTGGPSNQGDIYRQSTGGGTPTPLVLGDADDVHPVPIPGTEDFAFIRRTARNPHSILRQSPGSPPLPLLRAPFISDHSWAPHGHSVFFSHGLADGQTRAIARYDIGASSWQNILHPTPEFGYDLPAVSPDGRQLAYVRRTGRSAELFVAKLNSRLELAGAPRQLTHLDQRILAVQWTPDSRDLIFLNGPFETSLPLRVSASGGVPSRIAEFSQPVPAISIASHAWKIAFSIDLTDDNVWRYHLHRESTEALELVLTGSGVDEDAKPSPDGRSLVFTSTRTGRYQIWLADVDGRNTRQVTWLPDADATEALWTPDSQHLLITVRSGLRNTVYRTPAGGPYDLTPILEDADLLHTSPGGRTLFFARYPNKVGEIWHVPYPELAPATRLPLPGARYLAASPDGQAFYYSHRQEAEGLFVHQKNQPPPPPDRRLVERLTRRTLFDTGSRGLYYIAPHPAGKSTLFFLPYGARSPRSLHTFQRPIGWGFRLAPDERSLYLTLSDSDNTDIHLINSFR